VPGNFSPEYGRATGGIVDIHLKELKPKRVGGYVDVSVLDAGVYLEAPLGDRGGIAVAVRRSYLDAILSAAVPSDASVNLVTAPVYYDAQLLANYRLTPAHDLRAMAFGADDRLAILFKNPADFSQQATGNQFNAQTGFWRGLVADHYTPREGLENTLRLSAGQDGETLSEGDLVLDLYRKVVQLRDTLRLRLRPWATLVAGTDAMAERYSGHVRLPPPPEEGQPMSNQDLSEAKETYLTAPWWYSPGAFGELELRPTKPFLLSAGVRADYFQVIHQAALAPRLSVRYELSPRWAVKGALGLYYQPPDVFDFDQTHILAAVAAYDLPRHWRIASRFRYVSGNPQTPVVGSVFNSITDEYDPVFGAVNSARQPAFVQLDVRLDKQWVFDRWLLDAYVDLQNATNHTNPEGLAYNYDFTQSKVSQGLPILPFIGLRAEF
jgi:hypothetical protein